MTGTPQKQAEMQRECGKEDAFYCSAAIAMNPAATTLATANRSRVSNDVMEIMARAGEAWSIL